MPPFFNYGALFATPFCSAAEIALLGAIWGKLRILIEKLSFMHTKRFNTFLKTWVQFRLGAIPRLPNV